jgi:mono/diheme cytochrome c family protein
MKNIITLLSCILVGLLLTILYWVNFTPTPDVEKVEKVQQDTIPTIEKDDVSVINDTMEVSEDDDWISAGRKIYRQNCAVCHSFKRDLSGPKLTTHIGFGKMYEIIKNINNLEKSGDPYTIELLKKWDPKAPRMMPFEDYLSDDEIKKLISYLKYDLNRPVPGE